MQTDLKPKSARRYRFEWRYGNRYRLWVDGDRFFPQMLHAIERAERYVFLEIYLFESGHVATRFIDALCRTADRGVDVILLLDDYGATGLDGADKARLKQSGCILTFYNPLHYGNIRRNLFRDHRKLMVVDDERAFVGGAGITDQFDPPGGEPPWHETMLEITGPCVEDWRQLFLGNLRKWTNEIGDATFITPEAFNDGHPGRVVLNAPTRMEIKRSLIKRLRNAERRIWIVTAYFIPSRKIQRELKKAVKRGVDVRLLLPGPKTDHPAVRHAGRRYYARLLKNGVRIFEYQPRFIHAKILLCDQWVSLGSSNVDRWNFSWNLEANQELESEDLSDEIAALFEYDFTQSMECDPGEWHLRPWYKRLPEWFWGKVEIWLERRSQNR